MNPAGSINTCASAAWNRSHRCVARSRSPATPSNDGGPLRYDTHVDYFMADSPVEWHRHSLKVGHATAKVLTMKEPPSRTFAHLLEDLYAIPGEFIACLEWRRIPSAQMRRDLHHRRRHFFNKRISIVNYMS